MTVRPLIVGVCGGSGSGKTTLARALAQRCGPAAVLAEDDYYVCRTRVEGFDPATRDFDHPSSKDFDLLARHLAELKAGRGVRRPTYDFARHARVGEEAFAPAPLIVLEGLHLLSDARLRGLVDHAFFVDAPETVRFARRLARDVETRGRTADSVAAQWTATVQPAYARWIAPFAACAQTRLDGAGDLAAETARAAAIVAALGAVA
jgi:uridine kinase